MATREVVELDAVCAPIGKLGGALSHFRPDDVFYPLGWRMVNPEMNPQWTVSFGEGAEVLADRYAVSREDQDAFAVKSHRAGRKAVGVDPDIYAEGPIIAVAPALAKAGKSLSDVTTMKLNEAFAAQSLACLRQ